VAPGNHFGTGRHLWLAYWRIGIQCERSPTWLQRNFSPEPSARTPRASSAMFDRAELEAMQKQLQ